MTLSFNNRFLYFTLAFICSALALISLGPGMYGIDGHWMYHFFDGLCHQHPDRSFVINEYQMAVCSRCLGIYSFLLIGWISMPIFSLLKLNRRKVLIGIFMVSIAINLIDILGNYFYLWTNTLYSRFVLGALFGISIAILLNKDFFRTKIIGKNG